MSITIGPAHNLRSAARSTTTTTMEASVNDLTEKLRALETPGRLQTFHEGIDAKQYQQLMDMLLKQNATIASLEGQVMAASAGHAAGVPPPQHQPQGRSGYSRPAGQRFNAPNAWQRDRGVHRPPQHQGQATGGRDHR